ncbi:putative hydrolase/acyltransferase of alpha/beta superfamily domain protein [Mycobacterium xenopi 4042]|uniref:Putative hydrolase/acyltransferase of alpha/beta superfamily domain protein n=1 Tax=Mycobacterium xenopi 4042 TaxID=1299334 RepID=X7YLS7_MYCXE|nr:putative hydrolase/acyltransferase of alpha/beta superfamily domain protein [Mycobacterium xenopi 4042]
MSVARSMTRRAHAEDPYADEDFEVLDADRSYVVTTPDGVPLAVREAGQQTPADGGVRSRLLSAHGRVPFPAHPAERGVGPAGPDDLLRPARPRPFRRSLARDLHGDPTGQGPGNGAAGGRSAGPVVLVGHSMGA